MSTPNILINKLTIIPNKKYMEIIDINIFSKLSVMLRLSINSIIGFFQKYTIRIKTKTITHTTNIEKRKLLFIFFTSLIL